MHKYVVLLRGINVGVKNRIAMAELRACLESLGFSIVTTYIASGNVILGSKLSAAAVKDKIEKVLPKAFTLDSELVKVLVLNRQQLQAVIDKKPAGFGEQPDKYHSDVIFLMDLAVDDAMKVFSPRAGVDRIWPGPGVVYSQRLSAERTKSRLSKVMGTPEYKSMTIRTWGTVGKLIELLSES